MATTLSAKRIKDALHKVQDIGLYEEPFEMLGIPIVLRSLRSDDYEDIAKELADREDDETYTVSSIEETLCRSIVEINGINLRDVKYIEDEVEDPKTGEPRTVKLEKPAWVRDNVLRTWGKEALITTYRKFYDVINIAEDMAAHGVNFRIPDETDEDKLRRLLGEIQNVVENLPPALVKYVLGEYGLTTKDEALQKSLSKLDALDASSMAADLHPQDDTPKARVPITARQEFAPPPQRVVEDEEPSEEYGPAPAMYRHAPPARHAPTSRTARYSALEQEADLTGLFTPSNVDDQQVVPMEATPLTEKMAPVDLGAAKPIIDPPPPVGVNPRFRPQRR